MGDVGGLDRTTLQGVGWASSAFGALSGQGQANTE